MYTNIEEDDQIIYVRLENDETGCVSTNSLELIVNPIPEITPTILEVCDANYDGVTTIDLTLLDAGILNGQQGIDVTYHLTPENKCRRKCHNKS